MYDKIEKLRNSTIQHGKQSDRVYLMKLDKSDVPDIITDIENLAIKNAYTKLFTKIPFSCQNVFEQYNYHQEAFIPGFFNGKEDASFMVKFLSDDRKEDKLLETIKDVINVSKTKEKHLFIEDKHSFTIRICTPEDAPSIVKLYKEVFESYPFPIYEPDYIIETMQTHIHYYSVYDGDQMVALASSETDDKNKNVEMTDFATLNEYRGHNLSLLLLDRMEKDLKNKQYITSYTIARSLSYGMNITFAKMGYKFGGTLINNTGICGALESMNIWYKHL